MFSQKKFATPYALGVVTAVSVQYYPYCYTALHLGRSPPRKVLYTCYGPFEVHSSSTLLVVVTAPRSQQRRLRAARSPTQTGFRVPRRAHFALETAAPLVSGAVLSAEGARQGKGLVGL